MADAPQRRTWITLSRITATGRSSRTAAICKACATSATAQRPWRKAELNLAARAAGRADAWTSAVQARRARLWREIARFPGLPPTPKKFSAAGRLTAAGLPCEIFSQWSGNFGGFGNGKQEKRRSGRSGRGKSGVVYAGAAGAGADRRAGAVCAEREDAQRELDRPDQSEPARVWFCQSGAD